MYNIILYIFVKLCTIETVIFIIQIESIMNEINYILIGYMYINFIKL